MSTFRVYGMTEAKARQMSRALPPPESGAYRGLRKACSGTLRKADGRQPGSAAQRLFRCAPVRQAVYRHSAPLWSLPKPAHQVPSAS